MSDDRWLSANLLLPWITDLSLTQASLRADCLGGLRADHLSLLSSLRRPWLVITPHWVWLSCSPSGHWSLMVGASLSGPASTVLTSWHEDGELASDWSEQRGRGLSLVSWWHRDLEQTRTRGWQSTHTSDTRDTNIMVQGRDGNLNEFLNLTYYRPDQGNHK